MSELVLPNAHALFVMVLLLAALALYANDRIRYETTSLVILALLALVFQLFPYSDQGGTLLASDFFLGFGNRGLVAVCALMILGRGIVRTGALEPVGRWLARLWQHSPLFTFLLTLVLTVLLSSFINDTPVVVMMMPIMLALAASAGQPPSRTLMPMGFATILGGMMTTIGTSTNLLVVNVAADMGMEPFGMFDWTPAAAIGVTVGVLYLWLVAPRLLPDRETGLDLQQSRLFTAQIRLRPNSPVVGRSLGATIARIPGKMKIRSVQRPGKRPIAPLPDLKLGAEDRLLVTDTRERLNELAIALGGSLYSGDRRIDEAHPLLASHEQVAEIAITPVSRLVGQSVREAQLKYHFGLDLLAFQRYQDSEERRLQALEERAFAPGDILLVQSTRENLERLRASADLLVLDGAVNVPRKRLAPVALLIMTAVVTASALNWVPIEISALLGCLALLLTGCLDWKEAAAALSSKVILIIVASLAMGSALSATGGSEFLALLFVKLSFGASPAAVLMGLMLVMAALTNVVSNNAAAVIGTPIAIGIAQQLGLPMEPFVIAVVFGANLSFATPMAYQTHVLVMNAAGYTFGDFVRVGVPLTLLVWLALSLSLIWSYGL